MLDSTFSVHEIEAKWAVKWQKKPSYLRPVTSKTGLDRRYYQLSASDQREDPTDDPCKTGIPATKWPPHA
jgi:hypothetical protein